MTIEEKILKAMKADPYAIQDLEYLISYLWVEEDLGEVDPRVFAEKHRKLFTYFIKHTPIYSIIREAFRVLEKNATFKLKAKTTDFLRREITSGETTLFKRDDLEKPDPTPREKPSENVKERLAEARAILEKKELD